MRQETVRIGRCGQLLAWVRCGLVVATAAFACVACSPQESSAHKKAPTASTPGGTRDFSTASNSGDFSGISSHSKGAPSDEHLSYPISEVEPPILQGTVDVPPGLMGSFDSSSRRSEFLGSDPDSYGIMSPISPADQTPDATVAPLPSIALSGVMLLSGMGLLMLVRAWRIRAKKLPEVSMSHVGPNSRSR